MVYELLKRSSSSSSTIEQEKMSLIMPTLKKELIYFKLDFLSVSLSLSLLFLPFRGREKKNSSIGWSNTFATNENISGWIEETFVSLIWDGIPSSFHLTLCLYSKQKIEVESKRFHLHTSSWTTLPLVIVIFSFSDAHVALNVLTTVQSSIVKMCRFNI